MAEVHGSQDDSLSWDDQVWSFPNLGNRETNPVFETSNNSDGQKPETQREEAPPAAKGRKRNSVSKGCNTGGVHDKEDGGRESEHELHIWTERERRKKMRNMFANLHALLPHLPPKTQQKFSSNANSAATQIQQQHKFSGNANSAVGHSATQIKRLEFSDATFGSWTFGDANSAAGDLATQTSSSPRNFIIQISRNPDFCSRTSTVAYSFEHSINDLKAYCPEPIATAPFLRIRSPPSRIFFPMFQILGPVSGRDKKAQKLQHGITNPFKINRQNLGLIQSREVFLADEGPEARNSNPYLQSPMSVSGCHELPTFFNTWTSPNVTLSVCGEDAHISVCGSRKPGLLTAICFVMEKLGMEVITAQVSSDANRCMYMFHAHMLAGNTTREVESDTVAEQELKTVKRDFGGLNEGIWPKSSLGHLTKFNELCSLDRSGESSTGLIRKYAGRLRLLPCWQLVPGSDRFRKENGTSRCNSDAVQTMLISCCANVNELDVDVKSNLESAMMTSAFLLEEAVISNYDAIQTRARNTTREVESDTVAEQELKTVKRDFGGLNEGIWMKGILGHLTKFNELCSLDRSGGSSMISWST
ncbi:hypothetical protein F511_23821 [Dorcoceras hygrometricum]|uniref:BHLH domain-containing protein n=1 Tax=Dorcoceras hygrometricum TaxID=472368 RepID=A0A2Z7AZR0_9LAMI|nr:hypothetical protein F511_23821 [Dorcoceras hygrometricum]